LLGSKSGVNILIRPLSGGKRVLLVRAAAAQQVLIEFYTCLHSFYDKKYTFSRAVGHKRFRGREISVATNFIIQSWQAQIVRTAAFSNADCARKGLDGLFAWGKYAKGVFSNAFITGPVFLHHVDSDKIFCQFMVGFT
jgi:hypothetical protein